MLDSSDSTVLCLADAVVHVIRCFDDDDAGSQAAGPANLMTFFAAVRCIQSEL